MPSAAPDPVDPAVAGYFADRPAHVAKLIARLRSLVFDVAAGAPGVGALSEALKWGEPSYAPQTPRVGSSIRLAALDGKVALHFICHTGLVARFREAYPDKFEFGGNRSILFDPDAAFDEAALRHCVAMALTYHLAKRRS